MHILFVHIFVSYANLITSAEVIELITFLYAQTSISAPACVDKSSMMNTDTNNSYI